MAREVREARKALVKAGGKMVDARVEVDRKASSSIEQAVKSALLDRARFTGFARVVQVIVKKDCGPANCVATAEGVAIK